MLPVDAKHCWMFVAILLFAIFVENSICDKRDNNVCKSLLFVSFKERLGHFSGDVDNNVNDLCFKHNEDKVHEDCCNNEQFSCSFVITATDDSCTLILNENTLLKQDIVLITVPACEQCFINVSSQPNNVTVLLCIHQYANGVKLIRLSQTSPTYDENACKGLSETDYKVTVNFETQTQHHVSCKPPGKKPETSITEPLPGNNNGSGYSPEDAANIMKHLWCLVEKMGNSSTAGITIGNITGTISKLPHKNMTDNNFGITTIGNINILEDNDDSATGFSRSVHIPAEASDMAVKKNSSFVAVLLFPGMHQDNPDNVFLNNEAIGIEMGTGISNLSRTIDIHYRSVDKTESIACCMSWDGKGKNPNWIPDGCLTKQTNDSIVCQCSHLTFFAILMSPPTVNISSSDFTSLTYITSIGCGLSIFFLTVALFVHCLMRKRKASQTTEILINLFVAMFILNLSFLVNESIADLGNFAACVTMAAVMHYAMLGTFTWFFMEALHLYFLLWKLPTNVKHYMTKICVTGWVLPAVVVIALLASRQYDRIVIYTDDGNSAKMCWIPDAVLHQGVNIGYYVVVFIFTFVMFIVTLRQIVLLKPAEGKAQDNSSIKTNSFSILGLFLLLGITWAFAFFSYGPLRVPSYYIFTILNSFQGFFLVIYYFNSRKIVEEDRSSTASSRSTVTSNTVLPPPP